jgi:hypothetical protein
MPSSTRQLAISIGSTRSYPSGLGSPRGLLSVSSGVKGLRAQIHKFSAEGHRRPPRVFMSRTRLDARLRNKANGRISNGFGVRNHSAASVPC